MQQISGRKIPSAKESTAPLCTPIIHGTIMIYTKGDEAFLKPEPTPSHRKRNKKISPVGVHTNHMEGDLGN
jgi:hypothetical protein